MRKWLLLVLGGAACTAPSVPDHAVVHHRDTAPAWSIPYGDEHWLAAPATQISVDRVRHAIRDGRVEDPAFTASYDERGLALAASGGAPLRLQTSRIELGGDALEATGSWSILGNTAQRRWGAVVEHHAITGDGVELAWVLRERVAGPLTVELVADGLAYAGHTSGGDHYADGGIARVRIGAAALVDARGERWPLEPEREGALLRWRVPADLLARAAFPVALDPTIGPELGSDHPVPGTTGEPGIPALAWNGTEWLAVWQTTQGAAIHATRLSSTGAILDPAGIVIDDGTADVPILPRVASNGTDFFVAWYHDTADLSMSTILGERVSAAGVLGGTRTIATDVESTTFAIGDGAGMGIVSNGVDYTIAYATLVGPMTTHVSTAGSVDPGIAIDPGASVRRPAIAFAGTEYLVAWSDSVGIYGALLDASGHSPTIAIMSTGINGATEIASNGTDFLVVALDSSVTPSVVRGVRLSAAGVVLDPTPFQIAVDGAGAAQVAATGGNYLVTWSTPSGTCEAARVSSTGAVLDATPIALGPGTACAAGASATGYLLARGDDLLGVLGAFVSTAGVVAPSARISTLGANQQTAPVVATNGMAYLFVWSDDRASGELIGTRVSTAGQIEDVDGIVIAGAMAGRSAPRLGSNGTDYLVAWSAATDAIFGARVTAAGVPDPTPLVIAQHAGSTLSSPVLAGLGGKYLVAWSDDRTGLAGVYTTVVTAGVSADPAGTALAIDPDPTKVAVSNSIATNGVEYMVGWTRPVDGVHVTPVTQAGARKGTDVAFEGGSSDVSLASDGSDFLAVWQSSNGTSTAARISAAGADLDPSGIALGLATHARVTVDGFEYLVVFDAGQVIGARLTSTGRVFDTFSIALQGGSPSVVGFDGLPALVAYERRGRVTARLISATCGDAMLDPDEGCDDGNLLAHDGCNSLCQVEPGFMCTGSPSICQPFSALCGNVILCDPNAMCSSGPNGPTCICDQGYVGNGLACELQGSGGTGCGCAAHDGVPRDLPIVLALYAIGSRRRRKARPRSRR